MKVLFVLLFLVIGTVAQAQTSAELIEQIKDAVRAEAKAKPIPDDPTTRIRIPQWREILGQLDQVNAGDEPGANLNGVLEEIELAAPSERLGTLCHLLATRLKMEREQREAALVEEMQTGFTSAFQTWLSLPSSSVKKMDPLIDSIDQLVRKASSLQSNNRRLREFAGLGNQLLEFMRDWQDYKTGLGTGERSRRIWDELLNSPTGFSMLLPRSQILAAMTTPATRKWRTNEQSARTRDVLAGIHTLGDITNNLPKLDELSKVRMDGPFSNILSDALVSLRSYRMLQREEDEGRATVAQFRDIITNSVGINEVTSSLRMELLLSVLPRRLGVADTIPPNPAENAAAYLRRVAMTAREKSDWTLLTRALTLADDLRIDPVFIAPERAAMELFLAGLNQERARQYIFAVCSFESALKLGTQMTPTEVIGWHLQGIRETHGEEFEHGKQLALKSPPTIVPIVDTRGVGMIHSGNSLFEMASPNGCLTIPPTSARLTTLHTDPP